MSLALTKVVCWEFYAGNIKVCDFGFAKLVPPGTNTW
jgi:hypothetical protein